MNRRRWFQMLVAAVAGRKMAQPKSGIAIAHAYRDRGHLFYQPEFRIWPVPDDPELQAIYYRCVTGTGYWRSLMKDLEAYALSPARELEIVDPDGSRRKVTINA